MSDPFAEDPAFEALAKVRPLHAQASKPAPESIWPEPLDLEALQEREPQRPQFIVPDWLPCGYATLFAGHGGVGKSGIALHLAACIASGEPFFGMDLQKRRVLYLSCEDRESVLHWRLSRISVHMQRTLASLRGSLQVLDLVGCDSILWERARDGTTLGPAWYELQKRMQAYETEVVFVDGISDTYGGNENAKAEVKRYVNSLVRLIPPDTGAVVLIGHIAKPAAQGGTTQEGYSGTTGWHNSVRARWYLYPETEKAEDGDRPKKTGELLLELQKSNLGNTDQSMRFSWDTEQHLFTGQSATLSKFDRQHRDREELDAVRRAIAGCMASNITIPAAMQGPRTAYLTLAQRAEFPASLKGSKTARFRRILEQLRQLGYIEEVSIRRINRHYFATIALTTLGRAPSAPHS